MNGDFRFSDADDPATCYYEIAATESPTAARTQWLSFNFRGHDFVRHSPASHFAVILGATLVRDATGHPTALSGRGMTLGDTSHATPLPCIPDARRSGFGGARGAQIESFWPGGNFLYRNAVLLDDYLRDAEDYRVELEVSRDHRISASISSQDAGLAGPSCARAVVQDHSQHPVLATGTGVLIVLARGPVETGSWSAEFLGIRTGWR